MVLDELPGTVPWFFSRLSSEHSELPAGCVEGALVAQGLSLLHLGSASLCSLGWGQHPGDGGAMPEGVWVGFRGRFFLQEGAEWYLVVFAPLN